MFLFKCLKKHGLVSSLRNLMYVSDCIPGRMPTRMKIFPCIEWKNVFNFAWKYLQLIGIPTI